jgi:hypothetical protein
LHVGFVLAHLCRAKQLQTRDTVRPTLSEQRLEACDLLMADSDYDLPRLTIWDRMFAAESAQLAAALYAKACLERARPIHQARMHNAAVSPRLMAADALFLI